MALLEKKDIIVGITGASGAIYGVRLLEILRNVESVNTHLVITKAAKLTITNETNYSLDQVITLSDFYYHEKNIAAKIASGSFVNSGMIIAPCTVSTMAEVANGITHSLVSRAADVALKERRRLVMLLRETPLHRTHIENMLKVTDMGAIVAPPVISFYNKPETIASIVDYTVYRALDLLGISLETDKRWQGI